MTWNDVCAYDDLLPERGVAARIGSEQVALVRLHDGSVHVVGQLDPVTGVGCMSRGLVGSVRRDGEQVPVLYAPLYKEAYDVRDGRCVSHDGLSLGAWEVMVVDGRVLVGERLTGALGPMVAAPLARAS